MILLLLLLILLLLLFFLAFLFFLFLESLLCLIFTFNISVRVSFIVVLSNQQLLVGRTK